VQQYGRVFLEQPVHRAGEVAHARDKGGGLADAGLAVHALGVQPLEKL
jgi:hypothetical protein